jgi:uncharacterized protein
MPWISPLIANLSDFVAWSLIVLAAGGAICVAYGIFIERHWYRVATYRLPILPAGSGSGLMVVHVSDLHFVSSDRRKARLLA